MAKAVADEAPKIMIRLKVKGVSIEMTPQEAKELVDVLTGIVGKTVEVKTREYWPYYPYRWEPYGTVWTTFGGTTSEPMTFKMGDVPDAVTVYMAGDTNG